MAAQDPFAVGVGHDLEKPGVLPDRGGLGDAGEVLPADGDAVSGVAGVLGGASDGGDLGIAEHHVPCDALAMEPSSPLNAVR